MGIHWMGMGRERRWEKVATAWCAWHLESLAPSMHGFNQKHDMHATKLKIGFLNPNYALANTKGYSNSFE
jgi:hypothetical protein